VRLSFGQQYDAIDRFLGLWIFGTIAIVVQTGTRIGIIKKITFMKICWIHLQRHPPESELHCFWLRELKKERGTLQIPGGLTTKKN
jgi:hypothetical protein